VTISVANLLAHELIGLKVTISSSSDHSIVGTRGIVRDETRNMLTVEVSNRLLQVPKNSSWFTFDLPDGQPFSVTGSRIQFRPEDRIKRGLTKW